MAYKDNMPENHYFVILPSAESIRILLSRPFLIRYSIIVFLSFSSSFNRNDYLNNGGSRISESEHRLGMGLVLKCHLNVCSVCYVLPSGSEQHEVLLFGSI